LYRREDLLGFKNLGFKVSQFSLFFRLLKRMVCGDGWIKVHAILSQGSLELAGVEW
jgi:hypothetical protein